MKNIQRSLLFIFVIIACASARSQTPREANFCQGCRSVVSFMGNLNRTESRSDVRIMFRDFCETYYPPSTDFKGPCTWFVNGIMFVMDQIDPIYHCDQIGACGISTFRQPQKTGVSSLSFQKNPPSDNGFCSICQQLVNEAKAALEDPGAIDMAHKQLDTLCDYLKVAGISDECKQQVSKYIEQAVEFIHELDPLNYCQSIRLCQHSGQESNQVLDNVQRLPTLADFNKFGIETAVSIDNQDSSEVSTGSKNLRGPECSLCKTVIKALMNFLKENKTEERIKYGLEKICKLVYSDKDKIAECDQMIDSYSRELIEFVAAENNADLICILIEQCTYYKSPDNIGVPRVIETSLRPIEKPSLEVHSIGELMSKLDPSLKAGSFETCLECKVFIKYLRDQIDKPLTEAKIKQFLLTKLCNNLGDKELQDSCTSLIDNYADIFFKAVVLELNPESACIAIEACRNRTVEPLEAVINKILIQDDTLTRESSYECRSCVELVDLIDSFMSTYPGAPDAEVLISKLCPKITDQQLCENMIHTAGNSFVHHVTDMKEPLAVCSESRYC